MATNLGDLLRAKGLVASGAAPAEPAPAEAGPASAGPSFAPKVVVRRVKKGMGGKVGTTIDGVLEGRAEVIAALKKELGVGAREVEEQIVLQGDQVERAARWLEARGARKVVRS